VVITGRSNPTIKRIRALRSRKEREEQGLFFVEGIRIVREAADMDAPIETCVTAPDLLHSDYGRETVAQLERRGVPVIEVTSEVFETISSKEGPQGIGAVIRQRWTRLDDVTPNTGLCWVALHEVADPGNLGTIIRTADAVGAGGVILLGSTTDPYDPASLRASMGAIFSQTVVRTSFNELDTWVHGGDGRIVGTSDAAQVEYRDVIYSPSTVLLMGSERQGLPPGMQDACDVMVRIPMKGRSDSLNLAVATGVMLYEFLAQLGPVQTPGM
jgi:TrmH family RNA methyltransferase